MAEKLAQLSGAALVLGSATPSVEAYFKTEDKTYRLFTLEKRAKTGSEMAASGGRGPAKKRNGKQANPPFSEGGSGADQTAGKKRAGHAVFINRRGYSSFVSCRSCGEAVKCPHCDVSLTLHNRQRLVCHYCGYQIPMPKLCPNCGSPYLAGFGIGTQKIEEMAAQMFPEARLWMDLDTHLSKKGGHEKILSAFAKGRADILIGTQMIVKGHDFPGVAW